MHPRPDLLGRLGRYGRGPAPVLLSTELQRATREEEDVDEVEDLQDGLEDLAALAAAHDPADPAAAQEVADRVAELRGRVAHLGRTNVLVYGVIYVKTDGERLIAAFRKEFDF